MQFWDIFFLRGYSLFLHILASEITFDKNASSLICGMQELFQNPFNLFSDYRSLRFLVRLLRLAHFFVFTDFWRGFMKRKLAKLMVFLVLSLTMAFGTLFAVGCGESNPDAGDNQSHTHQYTTATVSPTCTALGYTTYTCDCGDTYKADYISAMGHDFTNYISNNDATYEQDGTQTAICNREGCAEKHTITTVGSKLTLDVFLELSVSGDYYIVTGLAKKEVAVLQIPESYNQIPVKEIEENAFIQERNIKEVVIPDGVTSIGDRAFV